MRIAVIGAGAIGSAVAAALVRAGWDVMLVARGQRLAELQSGPLRFEIGGLVEEVPVIAVPKAVSPPSVDLAICCVKAGDLEAAVAAVRPGLALDGLFLTLQNGVEAHEVAARLLPHATILAGRVHGFFEMDGGLVRHVGVPPSILVGCTQGDARRAEQALTAVFADSGIPVSATPDIRRALWEKLLMVASLGGVAAALHIPAGMVVTHQEGIELLRAAMGEVAAVAVARGITFGADELQNVLEFVARFPPDATTSLQRDLDAGRASEYDALLGAVMKMGRDHGVPHPTLTAIDCAIRARVGNP